MPLSNLMDYLNQKFLIDKKTNELLVKWTKYRIQNQNSYNILQEKK